MATVKKTRRFLHISRPSTPKEATQFSSKSVGLDANCGIRHVTVPIATRILIANVRHIGLSNICVINLVYFKMQV